MAITHQPTKHISRIELCRAEGSRANRMRHWTSDAGELVFATCVPYNAFGD